MRAQSGRILAAWRGRSLFSMPKLGELTVKEFEDDIDPHATADTHADLLTIILQNLVGNAVRHSAREVDAEMRGTVRIEAERQHEQGKDRWSVSVVDDGPGIPKEQLDRLFNAFGVEPQPGEGAFDDERGFGLGLAIASQAARLLGTTIEVKTRVGHGSTFSFSLPVFQPAPKAA